MREVLLTESCSGACRCGRDRGGGRHAGPAHQHGAAPGGGLQAVWTPGQVHHLYRYRPHCHQGNSCVRRAGGWGWEQGHQTDFLSLLRLQHLRQVGVVGKFVEFFGPGVAQLSIADRATIANMCPEYGATAAFFPVDAVSIRYLEQTGEPLLTSAAHLHPACETVPIGPSVFATRTRPGAAGVHQGLSQGCGHA